MKHMSSEMRTSAPGAQAGGPPARGSGSRAGDPLTAWTGLMCSGLTWYQAWFSLWCSAAEAGLRGTLAPRRAGEYARTMRSVMTPPPRLEAIVIPFVPRAGRSGTST